MDTLTVQLGPDERGSKPSCIDGYYTNWYVHTDAETKTKLGTVESYDGRQHTMVVVLTHAEAIVNASNFQLSPSGWGKRKPGSDGEGLLFSVKYITEYINATYRANQEMTLVFGAIPNETYQKYAFMLDGYKPDFFFWDTIEMFRKVVFVGLVSFFGLGSMKQLIFAFVVEVAFAFVCVYMKPYDSSSGIVSWAPNAFKMYFEATMVLTLGLTIVKKAVDLDKADQLDVKDGFIDTVLLLQLVLPASASILKLISFLLDKGRTVLTILKGNSVE